MFEIFLCFRGVTGGGETGRNFVLFVYVHEVGRKKNKEAAVFRIGIDTEC